MNKVNSTSPRRILIVDDDQIHGFTFAKLIESRGFNATVINDSQKVMELLAKESFDIILLDVVMPNLDGITLLKQIRSRFSMDTLPVIMVTSRGEDAEIFHAFEFGANDYITKPANVDAAYWRIQGQLSMVELNRLKAKRQEAEAVAAIIVTYHHEINNPLSIIKMATQILVKKHPELENEKEINKILSSITRIQATMTQILDLKDKNEVYFQSYSQDTRMIKIKG